MKRAIILLLFLFTLLIFIGPVKAQEIHLDLKNTLFSTTGDEGFKLFHVEAEGLNGTYWVEFSWDPQTLSFKPINAAKEVGYIVITAQELKSIIEQGGNYALLDVRTQEEYNKGHIKTSLNYPVDKEIKDFSEDVKHEIQQDFPDKDQMIIVYCGGLGCGRSGWAADSLVAMGYTNVFRFQAGYTGWCEAGNSFVITAQELKDLIDSGDTDYLLVDVREDFEYNAGHIPTAINLPLSRIRAASNKSDLQDILPVQENSCADWTKPIILYCAGLGTRYAEAASILSSLGYIRLVEFPGGMTEWNNMTATYKYKTAQELVEMLNEGDSVHIVDIRNKDDFDASHIKNSLGVNAYPVRSEEDKAKLDAILDTLEADNAPIVIICPRGAGGAERTYDYLESKGIDVGRLYILQNGWSGWSLFLNWTEVNDQS